MEDYQDERNHQNMIMQKHYNPSRFFHRSKDQSHHERFTSSDKIHKKVLLKKQSKQDISLDVQSRSYSARSATGFVDTKFKEKTLSDFIYQHPLNVINSEKIQFVDTPVEEKLSRSQSNYKENAHVQSKFEIDERQWNILHHKKISNIKLLISQTKQLVNLTENLLLMQNIRKYKIYIRDKQIQVRKLRIGVRKQSSIKQLKNSWSSSRGKLREQSNSPSLTQRKNLKTNLISLKTEQSQYYVMNQKHKFMNKNSKKQNPQKFFAKNQYYQNQIPGSLQKQRELILLNIIKNLKNQIKTRKKFQSQEQNLLKQQLTFLNKQNKNFDQMVKQASQFSEDIASVLAINSIIINKGSQIQINSIKKSNKTDRSQGYFAKNRYSVSAFEK